MGANFTTTLGVPEKGTQLLGWAEEARLGFADIAEAASMSAPAVFRNLVRTGIGMGMGPVEARLKARRVSRQLMYIAELANMQMVATRRYAINFESGFLHYNKPASGFDVNG